MRPLQLPTCIRRLFGAALASVVGPVVEPHMCDDQAAKAGGSCGPNIRRAYQHLEANMAEPRGTGRLWNDMMGVCRDSLDAFIEQHLLESEERTEHNVTGGQLDKEAAVLLADQKQAFERLSIGWFRRVLDGWRFPAWVRRSFMALVESRSVTATGKYGILRRLLRSIGIGGTASPLSWGIAYDPIVEGMSRAMGVEAPTYVDDLAGLINGPRQARLSLGELGCRTAGHYTHVLPPYVCDRLSRTTHRLRKAPDQDMARRRWLSSCRRHAAHASTDPPLGDLADRGTLGS